MEPLQGTKGDGSGETLTEETTRETISAEATLSKVDSVVGAGRGRSGV